MTKKQKLINSEIERAKKEHYKYKRFVLMLEFENCFGMVGYLEYSIFASEEKTLSKSIFPSSGICVYSKNTLKKIKEEMKKTFSDIKEYLIIDTHNQNKIIIDTIPN